MNTEIISIGDELLIGQVINTNQAYIAERLNSVGIFADRMTTVGDNEQDILSAFDQAWKTHTVVTVTGGLGPTHDDITRAAVCKFFQTDLVIDDETLNNVTSFFRRRNLPLTELNRDQARVPRGCTVIQNTKGTAPGYFFERDEKFFIVMPGVPYEMKEMTDSFVVPFFSSRPTGTVIQHRTLKTTGISESFLAEKLKDITPLLSSKKNVTLAYLPSPTGVRLRISVKAQSTAEAANEIRFFEQAIRSKVEPYIYGTDSEELEEVIGRILTEKLLTLAIAESCTGGFIAHKITNVSGSSTYFERGYVTYSNESKCTELGAPRTAIQQFGTVSKEVAEAMAFGARKKANTSIALAVTGIAGPTGGTEEKPVGLVWIGYSDEQETFAIKNIFSGERTIIKERAAQAALELLRRKLLLIPIDSNE
ncbi:MAG TPA: competence/damage-inducible protein A [Bacteroidota bacterium]|nr:competence/damage-inducible protein A [Bacteroidota bacterium]